MWRNQYKINKSIEIDHQAMSVHAKYLSSYHIQATTELNINLGDNFKYWEVDILQLHCCRAEEIPQALIPPINAKS